MKRCEPYSTLLSGTGEILYSKAAELQLSWCNWVGKSFFPWTAVPNMTRQKRFVPTIAAGRVSERFGGAGALIAKGLA